MSDPRHLTSSPRPRRRARWSSSEHLGEAPAHGAADRPRPTLPQLTSPLPYLNDGGLETTLIFDHGIDLPDFAAFPLVDHDDGVAHLLAYYTPYLELAARAGTGFVLDTPTWRANADWAERLGYDTERLVGVNVRAVELVRRLADGWPDVPTVINGVIGPRGDGYGAGGTMSPSAAAAYHGLQAEAFAEADADMISGITITTAAEASGIAVAATEVGLPAVISFTVETDGRLPSGQPLGDAIDEVDWSCEVPPAYYMVNCAHPTHFIGELTTDAPWRRRVRGVRANASSLSHAELDAATCLDRGDPDDLAAHHVSLARALDLCVVGGCCGTDHRHLAAIVAELVG